MSDDDRDNDIESDADKRAHHNALERKRRDHIKDSFTMLRDSLPFFQGDKVRASRAQILKKAADYIQSMRRKNTAHQQDIDDLKKQNRHLEDQTHVIMQLKSAGRYKEALKLAEKLEREFCTLGKSSRQKSKKVRSLEKAKATGNYAAAAAVIEASHLAIANSKASSASFDADSDSDDSSDISDESKDSPRKRLKSSSDVSLRT